MNSKYPIDVSEELQSGDIVHSLSRLSGMDKNYIEQILHTGKNPWELAEDLGVLGDLRDELLSRIFFYLDVMVEEQQLSREDADEMIALFEMYVPTDFRKADGYAHAKTELSKRTGADT